jgi:HAD superfamily hydrolase (TIGR01509 family)
MKDYFGLKNIKHGDSLKAIIFDFDGVLTHSKDSAGNYLWQKNVHTDLGLSTEQMSKIYSGNWFLVMKGKLCVQQHLKQVFSELDISLPIDKFIDYWHANDLRINEDIISLIKSIKNSKIYIGTNQDKLRATVIWHKFEQYFDGIFPSCNLGSIKPEVEFFRYIESAIGASSEEVAFIDDSKSHVDAASMLGWKCHYYQNIDLLTEFLNGL